MKNAMPEKEAIATTEKDNALFSSRRSFLIKTGSASLASALLLAACDSGPQGTTPPTTTPGSASVSLGSGDVGILNYAYALEQLEAAFYTQVVLTPYSGISSAELSLLTDIRDHEIAHREFFKTALASSAIAGLSVDFSSINFSSRDSVLGTAKAFEDLGVSAYNGAGAYIKTPDYLTLAGKIVSVEARHAAYIRDLISNGSFAFDLDMDAKEVSNLPSVVLPIAQKYVKNKIDGSQLP